MADISKISPDGGTTEYNLKDSSARNSISTIEEKIPSAASSSNKLVDQASLGTAASKNVGTANGVAELDSSGKVPSSQLPSYVDDVVDGYYKQADGKFYKESSYTTEIQGESDKIYISVDTDIQYRWTGSSFAALGGALQLGETSSTAYRGDRGKAAYDHATAKGSAFASGLYKITTNAEGHITAAAAVEKTDITALGIPAQDTVYDDTDVRRLISGLDSEIGDLSQLQSEDKSNVVNALNEVIEGSGDIGEFSGSQTILDSSGNEILDSSSVRILDTEKGVNGLVTTVSNIVAWFKSSLSHLLQDSGYTMTKELYEILNS